MNDRETNAILTLSLLAAFADGDKHDRERVEIRRIADGFSAGGNANVSALVQDVLMKRASIASTVAALETVEAKLLAYEMAVCVCNADGTQSDVERRFLGDLRVALDLGAPDAQAFSDAADALAAVPLPAPGAAAETLPSVAASGTVRTVAATPDDAELDRSILNAAILNGALELLPEALSTMAIIPLQMKLVYRIGQRHGFELDRGHVKDFLATAGVGLTSQYLEQAGRKLLGGLLGTVAGRLGRGLGNQAVSSGLSFASTYALGHVAKRYYAGGRTLSTQMLKEAYASIVEDGRRLQAQHLPAMRDTAKTLDARKVLELVRGS